MNEKSIEHAVKIANDKSERAIRVARESKNAVEAFKKMLEALNRLTTTGYKKVPVSIDKEDLSKFPSKGLIRSLNIQTSDGNGTPGYIATATFKFNYSPSDDTRFNKEKIKSGAHEKIEKLLHETGADRYADYRYLGYQGGRITFYLNSLSIRNQ